MTKYKYTGPLSGVSLKNGGDVMLHPGSVVEMSAVSYYTERLIRKGWLHEIVEAVEAVEAPEENELVEKPKRRNK